jgi:hypothetical protein
MRAVTRHAVREARLKEIKQVHLARGLGIKGVETGL